MATLKDKDLDGMHERAKSNFNKAYEDGYEIRSKIIAARRFALVPGAQWEGSTDGGYEYEGKFDLYPKFELNKVARECDRIISEYRNNRITVRFRPKDMAASEELAGKLNGRFRADFEESSGGEAFDNAFDGAVYGGFGCFRLDAIYEDEMDPMNEAKRICFKPVYDPETCVWFDQNSKEYDRSDAMWAMEVFSMTPDAFKNEYGDEAIPVSLQVSTDGSQYDWFTPYSVYVGRYYDVRIESVNLMSYRHPLTQEIATYEEDQIEEVKEELKAGGFVLVAERKVKMRRVYCGLMSGEEWLEKPERIPGEHIPLIPVYGKRHFVDNQERIEGHVAKAMDAQRLENLMVSMMADNATQAGGDNIPVLNIDGIPKSMTHMWGERNTKRPAYLPTTTLKDKQGNPIAASPLVGYTQPTPMSPALAGLLQYTGQAIQQITGSSMLENIPSNIATDTVDSIFNRMDTQSFIYMDNMAKSLRRAGVVYMSMARELYGTDQPMRIVNEDGTDDMVTMSGSVMDRETGREVALADLSVGKYEVSVDVGKSFATRRDATVRQLTEIQQRIPPQHPYFGLLMSMIIDNMDGEGIDDLKGYNRKQMLLQGVVKPRNTEEEQMVQMAKMQQANQPDPNMVAAMAQQQLAQAEMVKANTDAANTQIKAFTANADAQLKQAQTVKAMAEADNISNEQVRAALKLINDFSQQQRDAIDSQQQQLMQ